MSTTAYQNQDAEESVIGALMLSENAIQRVLPVVEASHFYRESYGVIFQTAVDLFTANQKVDAITLVDALERRGQLDQVGGKVKIHELAAIVPSSSNVGHYAQIVRDQWGKRMTHRMLAAAAEEMKQGASAEEALASVEAGLINLRGMLEKGRSAVVTTQTASQWLSETLQNPPKDPPGVRAPFSFLPRLVGGRLYVLGGYMGDGKTSLGCQFFQAACDGGARGAFVTMEMGWRDLFQRLIAVCGVNATRINRYALQSGDWENATAALGRTFNWRADIIDDEAADVGAIRSYQRMGRYDFLVIDHLHQFSVRAEYARQDYDAIVRGLTQLARSENIPILLLAQIRRAGDGKFPRPTMAMLKETSTIEALAAMVWLIWRERDERQMQTEDAELITAKNRFGAVGINRLLFQGRFTRYVEPMEER